MAEVNPDGKPSHRKIYGRGFADGLKKAMEDGVSLSLARARSIEQSLTGIQRKVYEVLPVQSRMSASEVCGEMRRVTGSNPDHRVVSGCLRSLVEQGLAREEVGGMFRREPIKDKPPEVKLEVVNNENREQAPVETPLDAIRRLQGEIVDRLDQIEQQAKLIVGERDKANERNAKAARLAELLKDFQ